MDLLGITAEDVTTQNELSEEAADAVQEQEAADAVQEQEPLQEPVQEQGPLQEPEPPLQENKISKEAAPTSKATTRKKRKLVLKKKK